MGNVLCTICRRTETDSTNPEPLIARYQDSDSDSDNCDVITQSSSEDSRSDLRCGLRNEYLRSLYPKKFTCYDEMDCTWLRIAATHNEADRIYVHGEILEWVVSKINEILNENLRATVEEVYHHNLDGPVYLIKFYKNKHEFQSEIEPNKCLQEIKDTMKYKMPWRTKPTFFLPLDPDFAIRKNWILNKLLDLNLLDGYSETSLPVNWSKIREIEIFEFSNNLFWESKMQIEAIFQEEVYVNQPSLYVCVQFEWHRICKNYIEVDKVAMDVCIEEWYRHDLLKDFAIQDILHLDLANKDYRDPYYNEYMDRYIDKLLKKFLLQLSLDDEGKHIFPVAKYQSYIADYFASRFDDKINIFILDNILNDQPNTELRCKVVNLIENEPSPDTLNHRDHLIEYNISNYNHFSDSLLRQLLNNSNNKQTYNIRFDREFNFTYPTKDKEMVQHLMNDQRHKSTVKKLIVIELLDCIEINAQKLVDFVKYLFKLFRERKQISVQVWLWFNNCMLDDYSFFEHIKDNIDVVQFERMNISTKQMKILSSALTQQNVVAFLNCKHLTDNDLMILLENIAIKRLRIFETNSCTPAIYYLIAEYLMNKEGVDTIMANRVKNVLLNWPYNLKTIELFNNGDQIVVRDRHTKKLVDLYCLLNGIEEDLDPCNRMYME